MESLFASPVHYQQATVRFCGYATKNYSVCAYTAWEEAQLPIGAHRELSSRDMLYLCRLWQQVSLVDSPEACVQRLAKGEQEGRWVIPEIAGILSPDYWEGLFHAL